MHPRDQGPSEMGAKPNAVIGVPELLEPACAGKSGAAADAPNNRTGRDMPSFADLDSHSTDLLVAHVRGLGYR